MMMKGFGLDESIMSNLTSTLSGETSISSSTKNESSSTTTTTAAAATAANQGHHLPPPQPPPAKKKRSLPGNPDPDAEVIALSPKSLLATNRFICEICNKGFQRDQNLQLHRRGHNLPWKLKQRANKDQIRKKVYVCPEPSCVHHDPARALGDLTGIKKHFCRKHGEKKWKCDKCSKKYAVQSDWKAHSKICGTREYRCDCGTLFSRRDSFITHRAFCDALAAAEEGGRYSSSSAAAAAINIINNHHHHSLSLPSPHLLHSLSSLKRDSSGQVSFPPWLSSSSAAAAAASAHSTLSPQQPPGTHLYASVDDSGSNTLLAAAATSAPPPQMSATALLQKAAEMGVTLMSNHHHQQQEAHHATASSSPAGMCSSRDQALHDMMIMNSFQSTSAGGGGSFVGFEGGGGFGEHHMIQSIHHHNNNNQGHHQQGVMTPTGKPPVPPFNGVGDGGGRGDGLSLSTRDFLGLRTFTQKDLMNMAGLQAHHHHHHINNSSSNSAAASFDHHNHHQQQQQIHHHDDHQQDHDHHQNQTPW